MRDAARERGAEATTTAAQAVALPPSSRLFLLILLALLLLVVALARLLIPPAFLGPLRRHCTLRLVLRVVLHGRGVDDVVQIAQAARRFRFLDDLGGRSVPRAPLAQEVGGEVVRVARQDRNQRRALLPVELLRGA